MPSQDDHAEPHEPAVPRSAIRRFDVFAEYSWQERLDKGYAEDGAKGLRGVALVIAAPAVRAGPPARSRRMERRNAVARAPFQVLVFPYRIVRNGEIAYAVFRRRDEGMPWQAISGGGEDAETPLEAARREAWEEASIAPGNAYVQLESLATIPVVHFADFRDREDMFVIPEFSFGVEVVEGEVRLSHEHADYAWLPYQEAHAILRWDSNKNALWELDRRLQVSPRIRPDT